MSVRYGSGHVVRTSEPKWVTAGIEVAASRRCTWVALCGVSRKNKRVVVKVVDPLDGTAVTGALVALWERMIWTGLRWTRGPVEHAGGAAAGGG